MSYNIAIIGATGAVGHKLLSTILNRKFPTNEIYLLASKKSAGKKITFKSNILKRNIKLNVSNSALRTVDYKGGLDFYLKSVKSFKLSPKAKKLKTKIISVTKS